MVTIMWIWGRNRTNRRYHWSRWWHIQIAPAAPFRQREAAWQPVFTCNSNRQRQREREKPVKFVAKKALTIHFILGNYEAIRPNDKLQMMDYPCRRHVRRTWAKLETVTLRCVASPCSAVRFSLPPDFPNCLHTAPCAAINHPLNSRKSPCNYTRNDVEQSSDSDFMCVSFVIFLFFFYSRKFF